MAATSVLYTPEKIQRIYLTLLTANTLAASFIWGINTLFLLNAGLSNAEAFAANAFFTVGQVVFEIPTGIVADTMGRRTSYLLGCLTLMASTLWYLLLWQQHASFWPWAASSMLLGLGFTFFSGAVEAWLVDALHATGFKGELDSVFAKGQIITGVAMLTGSVLGGIIAQMTNLGVPYIIRSAILGGAFLLALIIMKDVGFTPEKRKSLGLEIKRVFTNSVEHGIKNRNVKWLMFAAPFTYGVSFYVFYALQPYLLQLYGDEKAYSVAGIIAALLAGAQIVGGIASSRIRHLFTLRSTALIAGVSISAIVIALMGLIHNFFAVIILAALWGLMSAAVTPIRQSYLNGLIQAKERATVLSFDSLMGSSGGIVIQPVLGRAADIWNYPTSLVLAGLIQAISLPFLLQAKNQRSPADLIPKENK
jgi:MFS family permease